MDRFRFIWRAWNYRIIKERAEIKCLFKCLSLGDVALDIGANKGAYTYWMAKAVGLKGKVIAFEPQPNLSEYLKNFFNSPRYNMVRVESIGLSSKCGQAHLIIPEKGKTYSPGATLELKYSEEFYSYTIKTDTIDNYLENTGLGPVRFIKCDVEGHELDVFKGAEKILKKDHPSILFECESRHLSDHKIEDVFTYLENLGYHGCFFLCNRILPLNEFDIKKHQIQGRLPYVNNFLFNHVKKIIELF